NRFRTSRIIGIGKLSAAQQSDSHRSKVVWGNGTVPCDLRMTRFCWRTTLNFKSTVRSTAAQRQTRNGAGRLNPGQSSDPLGKLFVEGCALVSIRITRSRKTQIHSECSTRIESRIYAFKIQEALDHQPGANHQHKRQRHFGNDKDSSHSSSRSRSSVATAFFERPRQVRSRRENCWRQPERDPSQD